MTNYKDPENVLEIMEHLKTLQNLKEVKDLMNEVFPSWFVCSLPRYSKDYEGFQTNWVKVANMINVPITQIIIVDDMIFDEEHSLIRTFAELLTRSGFSVRRKDEFIPCEKCGNALPTREMYEVYKKVQEENGIKVPITWSNKCKNC